LGSSITIIIALLLFVYYTYCIINAKLYFISHKGPHEEWDSEENVEVTVAATSCLKITTQ